MSIPRTQASVPVRARAHTSVVRPTPDERLAALAAAPARPRLTVAQARAGGLTSAQLATESAAATSATSAAECSPSPVTSRPGSGPCSPRCSRPGRAPSSPIGRRARLLGFDGFAWSPPEVTVPRGQRPRAAARSVRCTPRCGSSAIDMIALPPFRVTSGAPHDDRPGGDGDAIGSSRRPSAVPSGTAGRPSRSSRRRFAALRGPGRHGAALPGGSARRHRSVTPTLERRFLRLVARAGLPPPVDAAHASAATARSGSTPSGRRHRLVVPR